MLLRALLGAPVATREAINLTDRNYYRGSLTGPVDVTSGSALSIAAAFRCVQLVSDMIGSLPLQRFRDTEWLATVRRLEDDRPAMDTVSAMVTSLLMHGNAYLVVADRAFDGFPTLYVHVDPRSVATQVLPSGRVIYRVGGRELDAGDVIHVRGMTMPGQLTGMGVLEYQRRTIAQAVAAEDYAGELWTTGAVPDGVIESDHELSKAESDQLANAFEERIGGRQRRPPVLSGGIRYNPLTWSNADLEMLESRKWNSVQVCSAFGVPPFLAGVPSGESKTYQNIQQDSQWFVRFTLRPWLARIEAALSSDLVIPRTQQMRFNLDALMRPDTKDRYDAHAVGLTNGFLTLDEVRSMERRPPIAVAAPDDEPEDDDDDDE